MQSDSYIQSKIEYGHRLIVPNVLTSIYWESSLISMLTTLSAKYTEVSTVGCPAKEEWSCQIPHGQLNNRMSEVLHCDLAQNN